MAETFADPWDNPDFNYDAPAEASVTQPGTVADPWDSPDFNYDVYEQTGDMPGLPITVNQPPPMSLGNRVAMAAQRLPGQISEAFTGDERREFDIGEVGQDAGNIADAMQMGVARGNPLGMAAIYQARNPDAVIKYDKGGAPYVESKGGQPQVYLNRPGFSGQEVIDIGQQGLAAWAAMRGGVKVPGGVAGRIGGVAGAEAATSLGFDALAKMLGSEQGFDVETAAMSGALGGLGEAALPAWRLMKSYLSRPGVWQKSGKLTADAAKDIKEIGLDPDLFSRDRVKRVERNMGRVAQTTEEAGRVAEAASLPVSVPLTEGMTRGGRQGLNKGGLRAQELEQQWAHGVSGDAAQQTMQRAQQRTNEALLANVPEVQRTVSGRAPGEAIRRQSEGAANAGEAIADRAAKERAEIDAAYTAARGGNAGFAPGSATHFANKATAEIGERHALSANPALERFLNEIPGRDVPRSSAVLRDMETWRRQVTTEAHNLKVSRPSEARALNDLVRSYDDFTVDSLRRGLVDGDQEAVKLWRKAVAKRRNYGRVFEANDIVKKLTQEGVEPIDRLTPEDTLNLLFGGSKTLKATPKASSALRRMRAILGNDSDSWNALKEEAFLRLVRNQPQGAFSPDKFATALDTAMLDSPTLMRTLFGTEDMKLLQRLKRVGLSTIPDPKAVNRSHSSYPIMKILGQYGNVLAFGIPGKAYEIAMKPAIAGVKAGASVLPGAVKGSPISKGGRAVFTPGGRSRFNPAAGMAATPGLLGQPGED